MNQKKIEKIRERIMKCEKSIQDLGEQKVVIEEGIESKKEKLRCYYEKLESLEE